MKTGTIHFIQKNRKPLFPVTRAEAVIVNNTTLDKILNQHEEKILDHEGRIVALRTDVNDITKLDAREVLEAYNDGITE